MDMRAGFLPPCEASLRLALQFWALAVAGESRVTKHARVTNQRSDQEASSLIPSGVR